LPPQFYYWETHSCNWLKLEVATARVAKPDKWRLGLLVEISLRRLAGNGRMLHRKNNRIFQWTMITFAVLLAFMWFANQIETAVAEPVLSPLEKYEENRSELRMLGEELTASEEAIRQHIGKGKDPRFEFLFRDGNWSMQTRVNAMALDPTLQKLEWNRAEILRKRAVNLSEGVRLKKQCGLANY
jgi:hypothetical protein